MRVRHAITSLTLSCGLLIALPGVAVAQTVSTTPDSPNQTDPSTRQQGPVLPPHANATLPPIPLPALEPGPPTGPGGAPIETPGPVQPPPPGTGPTDPAAPAPPTTDPAVVLAPDRPE